MITALCIVLGAGLGALARWGLSLWLHSPQWPWGTLVANGLGGLLAGAALIWLEMVGPRVWAPEGLQAVRGFLVIGFLGGLTTFSTFSVEVLQMGLSARWSGAVAWIMGHLLVTLTAAAAGIALMRWGLMLVDGARSVQQG